MSFCSWVKKGNINLARILRYEQLSREDVGPTYQQNSDRHERSSSSGHGAVHEDDVVFTDVFGQTKVMKLEDGEEKTVRKLIKSIQHKNLTYTIISTVEKN